MKKKIIVGIGIVFALIQFVRIDKSVPDYEKSEDIIVATNPSAAVAAILKTTCYDCHSFESKYPWYSNIAPVSFFLKKHINEGREELNFSIWSTYSLKRKVHKLEEMKEMVSEGEMPLDSYLIMHSEAALSDSSKEKLLEWVDKLHKSEKLKE